MDTFPELISNLSQEEGRNTTSVDSIKLYRISGPSPRQPLVYEKGIIIIGQGEKNMYLGNRKFVYNKDTYLVVPFPVPVECETIAVPGTPLLGMTIDIDPIVLSNLVSHMDNYDPYSKETDALEGLYIDKLDKELKGILIRLLKVLSSPVESSLFANDIIKEFLYRLLKGANAAPLLALASKHSTTAKIEKALQTIHSNLKESHSISSLAKSTHMSISAFHKVFKDATACSPIQYIKKVRLSKAKELISVEGTHASEAARLVGYKSTTQFSREFKRHFGYTPKQTLTLGHY